MADAFFDRFSQQVQALSPPPAPPATATSAAAPAYATPAPAMPARPVAPLQPAAISVWALIPREPFGLPLAAWIGSAVFALMVLLMLGSML